MIIDRDPGDENDAPPEALVALLRGDLKHPALVALEELDPISMGIAPFDMDVDPLAWGLDRNPGV